MAEKLEKENCGTNLEKEEEGKVEDREITIMSDSYKIYVAIMAERVRKEVEKRGIIPQNQKGFRKKLSAIDNIYVLNYLVNKQLGIKKGA